MIPVHLPTQFSAATPCANTAIRVLCMQQQWHGGYAAGHAASAQSSNPSLGTCDSGCSVKAIAQSMPWPGQGLVTQPQRPSSHAMFGADARCAQSWGSPTAPCAGYLAPPGTQRQSSRTEDSPDMVHPPGQVSAVRILETFETQAFPSLRLVYGFYFNGFASSFAFLTWRRCWQQFFKLDCKDGSDTPRSRPVAS